MADMVASMGIGLGGDWIRVVLGAGRGAEDVGRGRGVVCRCLSKNQSNS